MNTKDNYKLISSSLYEELVSKYGEALVNRELALEEESRDMAYESYMSKLNQRIAEGNLASSGTTLTLIQESIGIYTKCIQEWCEAGLKKAARHHACIPFIQSLSSEKVAFIAIKSIINSCLINASKVHPLSIQIGKDLEDELRFSYMFEQLEPKEAKLAETNLAKRVGVSYKKNFLKSIEKSLYEEDRLEMWKPMSQVQLMHAGFKLIELFCRSTGLASLYLVKEGVKSNYHIEMDKDIIEYIFQNDKDIASTMFKNRPMVIPPKDWETPFNGGYYINLKRPLKLVRISGKRCNHLYSQLVMPNVYKAVNAIQSTPWHINSKVLEVANNLCYWNYIPEPLGMPTADPAEPPIRPEEADINEDVQKEWRHAMVTYYQRDNIRRSKRLLLNAQLSLANTYKDDAKIYFPHNLDFRGRVYPVTHLSPQSNDFGKALLEFAEGVELGENGATWLALQGANCYGLDKEELSKRIEWVYANPELILSIAEKPLEDLSWTETDSPWEFLAFCFEWAEYLKGGCQPTFKSHLAVAFDGSCSGIQHFSAMLRDEVGGTAVNLIPDDKVHDIYKMVADKVIEKAKVDLEKGTLDTMKTDKDGNEYLEKGTQSLAKEWLDLGITRSVTKRSVMTLPYGSRQYGFADQVLEDTIYPTLEKHPLAFSRPRQAARYMAKLIWDSVKQVVVKAVEAMEWLQKASGLLAKEKTVDGLGTPTYWITPAGFLVHQEYHKVKVNRIRSFLNGSMVVRDLTKEGDKDGNSKKETEASFVDLSVYTEGEDLDSRKQKQGIAPNFVHSMDASHLMLTVDECVDKGINSFAMIHDSYGTHAGNSDIMFKAVREVLVRTYTENNVLQDLHDHIANLLSNPEELPEVPAFGNLELDVIQESMYAFA